MYNNTIEAIKELLAAGISYREAEYVYRTASATKVRKALLACEETRNRLLRAEDAARNVIDATQ